MDQPTGCILTLNWILVIKSKQKLKEGQHKYNILEYNPVTNMKKMNLFRLYHLSAQLKIYIWKTRLDTLEKKEGLGKNTGDVWKRKGTGLFSVLGKEVSFGYPLLSSEKIIAVEL